MTKVTPRNIAIVAGTGLVGAGLSPIPLSDVFLVSGAALASLAYGLVFLEWREKGVGRSVKPGSAALRPPPSTPSSTPLPPYPEKSTPQVTPAFPSPEPTSGEPKPPKEEVPSVKAPGVTVPKPLIEHWFPLSMIAGGLALVTGAIYVFLGPQPALFTGLFVPGVLLLGIGSAILFLRLYRRPIGLRRFCMHCGFQMMSTDAFCGRCHKQPMSGIDTRLCPNCTAVIPALARFCRDCGAGQPGAS